MGVYRDSYLHLDKSNINVDRIKDDLTTYDRDFATGKLTPILYYFEKNDEILVPRYYLDNDDIEDRSEIGKNIKFTSKIKFRNDQQKEASDFIINKKSGLVQCPPGFGKTVITIHALSQIKKRTLIIVDQNNLREQWIERFIEHSSLTEEDFDSLTKLEKSNTSVTITTIQNLLAKYRKDKEELIKFMKASKYGVVIFDEVHALIGPKKFTMICGTLFAKKIFGLSATPFRDNDRRRIITYWLTDNYFLHSKYTLKPNIKVISFNSHIPEKTCRWVRFGGSFNLNRYYKSLFKHTQFMNMVADIINKLHMKDRHILLLVGRIKNKYLDDLKNILVNAYKINEEKISIYVGGIDKSEVSKPIVLSNYIMAYKGLDEPSLDTLILMTSTYSEIYIEQAIGRILRIHKDKKDPLVIDFCDNSWKELKDASKVRYSIYNTLNFELK